MPEVIQAHVGKEQVFTFEQPFVLESGQTVHGLQLHYTTHGQLNESKNNVIWVCHALTGNDNVLDWWQGLFGSDKFFSTDNYFIICVNVPGSCYGSTGPLSINPLTETPYYHDFPFFSMRDVVRAFDALRQSLGIKYIHTCIGGSLGGQQALQWAVIMPELIENLVLLATNARTSPWGIALNETQRMAIAADATWGKPSPTAGIEGMKVARAIALLSYRSYQTYAHTQADSPTETTHFKAITYQQYQGEKFAKRFNAYSYWALTKLLDSHHVGIGYAGVEAALQRIKSRTLIISVASDLLFPPQEQEFMHTYIKNSRWHTIESLYGHDGFLIETDKIVDLLSTFYITP